MSEDTIFGFGCMRLPQTDEKNPESINQEEFNKMVDYYMENGFNYFDTSYAYHNGKSEIAIKKAVIDRYPRESYKIADKLPTWLLQKTEDNEKYFNEMLERLNIKYFDNLFIHNINKSWLKQAKKANTFDFVKKIKEEGKAKQIGFSFHDLPELLEETLKEYSEIFDFVQLEINYFDWEDPILQAKKCYEIVSKYNLDIYVMEPLKGGTLVNINEEIKKDFKKFNPNASIASFALRFCASLKNVKVVLSGMNKYEDVVDNCKTFTNFKPLNKEELKFLEKEAEKLRKAIPIHCSYCNYCIEHCPVKIPIPEYFNFYNNNAQTPGSHLPSFYYGIASAESAPAKDCIECGTCVDYCTQKINIPEELKKVSKLFDTPEE